MSKRKNVLRELGLAERRAEYFTKLVESREHSPLAAVPVDAANLCNIRRVWLIIRIHFVF